jgi:signal transduction histidine kinase/uncharacterized membrane protein YagU involved in acid resistance
MSRRVNYSGLVIAGIGFFLTRFTVTLALNQDPMRFYFAGVVPLVLGLGLAAFGVALAVADIEAVVVRTVAAWTVIGTLAMLVLVVLTLVGSSADGMPAFSDVQAQVYLSTFLIGGSVGGTLTGLYASLNRRQRVELERQANRLEVLNRLLRHEVLNALTVIRGYAPLVGTDDGRAADLIQERSDDIEATIDEVQYLARSARAAPAGGVSVGLAGVLEESAAAVRERFPDASVSVGPVPADLEVEADARLSNVFTQLLTTAAARAPADKPGVEVSVEVTPRTAHVTVAFRAEALSAAERALLERGEIGEYDDPSSGFELNLIRLLVESYHGRIEAARRDDRTELTVVLPRPGGVVAGDGLISAGVAGVRPAIPTLVVTLAAALLAGVAYGIVSEALGGSIAGIGVFYGAASPLVGWITHEFHSVVFGFVFVGLVSVAPARHRERYAAHLVIGLAWGLVLWLGAAGVIAPVWLRLLGIPASLPSLSGRLLLAHLVWGASLGLLTAWGYRHVAPRLARLRGGRPRASTGE